MAAALKLEGRRLGDLLGAAAGAHANLCVRDLVLDSRQVEPGAAFIAVPGARAHGLSFAAEALARGAVVVLYEPSADAPAAPQPSVAVPELGRRIGELARAFFASPAAAPAIAGITGTNGKTTVAYLVAEAATRLGPACAYIGTLGYGVPPTLTEHALTTPDCLSLHREIAALATPRVAMEVSSHALAQDRISGLCFDSAVFTNLTREHLDAHGDMDAYGRAKARLFTRSEIRHAVLNLDDPFAATLQSALVAGSARIGTSLRAAAGADLTGSVRDLGLQGLSIGVGGRFGRAQLRSSLIGGFNAENLLLALGVLLAWDLPLDVCCAALSACPAPPGRMQVLGGAAGAPTVVIDYAHTPDALERVLAGLRAAGTGRLWCVFGCGGERDPGKRPLMGRAAAALADTVVLTDDNPRAEDPERIVAEIRSGIEAGAQVRVEHARDAAIAYAIAAAGAGDTVLIAGKGHERRQLTAAGPRPFSDRAAALAALEARK